MKKKKYTYRNWVEYIKDNPQRYWFKRKLYGWGWFPVTREGWGVVFGFIFLLLINSYFLTASGEPTSIDLVLFFLVLLFLITGLIWICYKKGEKPKWTWGR